MFLVAALVSEQACNGRSESLLRQIGPKCVDFFMKGVGVVPHAFSGRPKTADYGAPNCRFGFSYADLRKVHPKPLLQQVVPGPFKTAQVGFTATRNALWNKPLSFNSATMVQRISGTYSATEPRFETLLTRMSNANPPFEGFKLARYNRQLRQPSKVPNNCIRAALFREELCELKTHKHAQSGEICSTFLSGLQSTRSREFQAAPQEPKVQTSTPLHCKPWRLMIPHDDDLAMVELKGMAVLTHGTSSKLALSAPPQRSR
jgi:hypothetical protein